MSWLNAWCYLSRTELLASRSTIPIAIFGVLFFPDTPQTTTARFLNNEVLPQAALCVTEGSDSCLTSRSERWPLAACRRRKRRTSTCPCSSESSGGGAGT